MITTGNGYILRHRRSTGRYLRTVLHIETDSAGCHVPGVPMVWTYYMVKDRLAADAVPGQDHWTRWIEQDPSRAWIATDFEVVPGPGCSCCGERWGTIVPASDGGYRCPKHADRNPCAIEGCARTREAPKRPDGTPWLASDQVLCSDHWRRFVPPRSKLRRHYHLIFRRAKREGWTDALERRYWRYWGWLVAQARRKATGGDLDIAAIERMFGI